MAKTKILVDLQVGPGLPTDPSYIRFTPPNRFVSGSAVYLAAGIPLRLVDGKGEIDVEPGVWIVDELALSAWHQSVKLVPESETPIQYSDLVDVASPAQNPDYGPSWSTAAQFAAAVAQTAALDAGKSAADAAESAAEAARIVAEDIEPQVQAGLATIRPSNGQRAVGKGELSVRLADYFAAERVEGVTDDTSAFQAARDVLVAGGGGTLLIDTTGYVGQPLDFLFTAGVPIRITTPADRSGAVKVLDSVPLDAPLETLFGHPKPDPWSAGLRHEISSLRIDGNKRVKRIVSLINAHAVTVRDNHILNPTSAIAGGSCIYINADGEGISWENKITGNRCEGGSGDVVEEWADYCIEVRSSDNHIHMNVGARARVAIFYSRGGNNFFIQNHAFYGPYHFVSPGNFGSTWIGNEADGPGIVGFDIYGNNSVVQGNRTFFPGDVPETYVASIRIPWSISDSTVMGNTFHAENDTTGRFTDDKRILVLLNPKVSTIIKDNPGATVSSGLGLSKINRLAMTYADSTPVGGNPRGALAADLQFARSSADQVASGAGAFAAGARNRIAGNYSAAVGELHSLTGTHGFASGRYTADRGIWGARLHAAGRFAATGDQQAADYILAAITTATALKRLTVNQESISATSVVAYGTSKVSATFDIDVIGRDITTGDTAVLKGSVAITKGDTAASTVLVGDSTLALVKSSGAGATATGLITVDVTRGGFSVNVTAPNANEWHWVARVRGIEIG